MKKALEKTRDEEIALNHRLLESYELAQIECWDELERDDENEYDGSITLGIGRIRMVDGRLGEYQLTLELDSRKFVDDEFRTDNYVVD